MPIVTVEGLDIDFPFDPYPGQIRYMEEVVRALDVGGNALLESPTGTGKTLCLLCATLAWTERERRRIVSAFPPQQRRSKDHVVLDGSGGSAPAELMTATVLSARSCVSPDDVVSPETVRSYLPHVVYASRTHSQLSQVIKELRRLNYTVSIRSLASRQQLCTNPSVKALPSGAQNHVCRTLVRERRCGNYLRTERMLEENKDLLAHNPFDIEELVEASLDARACAYYLSRDKLADADIIFVPYNYVIDPSVRRNMSLDTVLANAVVVFDEAHNVESVCESSASYELSPLQLSLAIDACENAKTRIERVYADMAGPHDVEALKDVKVTVGGKDVVLMAAHAQMVVSFLAKLMGYIDSDPVPEWMSKHAVPLPGSNVSGNGGKGNGETYFTTMLYSMMLQAGGVTHASYKAMVDTMEALSSFLLRDSTSAVTTASTTPARRAAAETPPIDHLEPVVSLLRLMFDMPMAEVQERSNDYMVHIQPDASSGSVGAAKKPHTPLLLMTGARKEPQKVHKTLSYWCFSAAVAVHALLRHHPRSLLFTSGTLSPLGSFARSLGVDFSSVLENGHVIDDDQVWAGVVCTGPTRHPLLSTYATRGDATAVEELGRTVLNVARQIPDGLLVFFPSYAALDSALTTWAASPGSGAQVLARGPYPGQRAALAAGDIAGLDEEEGSILAQIGRVKKVFVEPRTTTAFASVMGTYKEHLAGGGGAVFCGICRGKASEGFDFSDRAARGVIITGMPYPSAFDPRVVLKRFVLDKELHGSAASVASDSSFGTTHLSGKAWYTQEALRAVNQAVGRVIRHRLDFGAVIFCDSRFASPQIRSQLPSWLRPRVESFPQFGPALSSLSRFMRAAREKYAPEEHARAEAVRKATAALAPRFASAAAAKLRASAAASGAAGDAAAAAGEGIGAEALAALVEEAAVAQLAELGAETPVKPASSSGIMPDPGALPASTAEAPVRKWNPFARSSSTAAAAAPAAGASGGVASLLGGGSVLLESPLASSGFGLKRTATGMGSSSNSKPVSASAKPAAGASPFVPSLAPSQPPGAPAADTAADTAADAGARRALLTNVMRAVSASCPPSSLAAVRSALALIKTAAAAPGDLSQAAPAVRSLAVAIAALPSALPIPAGGNVSGDASAIRTRQELVQGLSQLLPTGVRALFLRETATAAAPDAPTSAGAADQDESKQSHPAAAATNTGKTSVDLAELRAACGSGYACVLRAMRGLVAVRDSFAAAPPADTGDIGSVRGSLTGLSVPTPAPAPAVAAAVSAASDALRACAAPLRVAALLTPLVSAHEALAGLWAGVVGRLEGEERARKAREGLAVAAVEAGRRKRAAEEMERCDDDDDNDDEEEQEEWSKQSHHHNDEGNDDEYGWGNDRGGSMLGMGWEDDSGY